MNQMYQHMMTSLLGAARSHEQLTQTLLNAFAAIPQEWDCGVSTLTLVMQDESELVLWGWAIGGYAIVWTKPPVALPLGDKVRIWPTVGTVVGDITHMDDWDPPLPDSSEHLTAALAALCADVYGLDIMDPPPPDVDRVDGVFWDLPPRR